MCERRRHAELSPRAEAMQSPRRWLIVVPILFLDFLVIAMPRSVLPALIDARYGAKSYVLLGAAEAAKGLLAFLATPALGALSDLLGRKWLFVACVVGTASPMAVMALTDDLSVYLITTGLSGLLAATFPLAFAFIADIVEPKARASAFGLTLGVGLGMAMLVGPLTGALINRRAGSETVFDLCLWLTIANVAIAALCMSEPPRKFCDGPGNRAEACRRANPLAALAVLRHHAPLRLLSAIVFFFYLSVWGFIANNLLYCRRRFGFTPEMSAGLLTVFGLCTAVAQSVGLRVAQRHRSEAQLVRGCFACSTAAFCIYGLAWEAWPLYGAMVLLGVSLGGFACVSSLASQVVPARVVGEAQGVLTSMKALTEGLGPLVVSALLQAFEHAAVPGAPWLLCAASSATAVGLATRLERTIAAHSLRGARAGAGRYADQPEGECLAPVDAAERSSAGAGAPADGDAEGVTPTRTSEKAHGGGGVHARAPHNAV